VPISKGPLDSFGIAVFGTAVTAVQQFPHQFTFLGQQQHQPSGIRSRPAMPSSGADTPPHSENGSSSDDDDDDDSVGQVHGSSGGGDEDWSDEEEEEEEEEEVAPPPVPVHLRPVVRGRRGGKLGAVAVAGRSYLAKLEQAGQRKAVESALALAGGNPDAAHALLYPAMLSLKELGTASDGRFASSVATALGAADGCIVRAWRGLESARDTIAQANAVAPEVVQQALHQCGQDLIQTAMLLVQHSAQLVQPPPSAESDDL